MSAITAFTRKDAKALLDTLAHGAKENKKCNGIEGKARRDVINNTYGFTRDIICYFYKNTRFYVNGCFYSRKELEDLLVSSYSH